MPSTPVEILLAFAFWQHCLTSVALGFRLFCVLGGMGAGLYLGLILVLGGWGWMTNGARNRNG